MYGCNIACFGWLNAKKSSNAQSCSSPCRWGKRLKPFRFQDLAEAPDTFLSSDHVKQKPRPNKLYNIPKKIEKYNPTTIELTRFSMF